MNYLWREGNCRTQPENLLHDHGSAATLNQRNAKDHEQTDRNKDYFYYYIQVHLKPSKLQYHNAGKAPRSAMNSVQMSKPIR